MLRILYILLLISITSALFAQPEKHHSGLTFTAHQENQDKRTGLNLTPEKPINVPTAGFSLEFDLRLRQEMHTYGYVCRLVFDNSVSFDVISHLLESKINFLITDIKKTIASTSFNDREAIAEDRWIHIKISFDKENVNISVGSQKQSIDYSYTKFEKVNIYFGVNSDINFYTNDVSPMSVKNIIIKNAKGGTLHQWDLSKHNNNTVFDQTTRNVAAAKNPVWEINKHREWHKKISFKIKSGENRNNLPQVAYDNNGGRVFIVTKENIYSYNVETNKTDTITPSSGSPYMRVGSFSQIIYDSVYNRIISYNPSFSELNFYNFDTNKWSIDIPNESDKYQQHNRLIDYRTNRLITFGGYGIHKYNAELAQITLDESVTWSKMSLDSTIEPRYLSALGRLNDENILILGGYGSISGKQEESPRNFYDLFKVNIDTKESSKLWSYTNPGNHYTFGNSMVIDGNNIYTLVYHNDRYNSTLYLASLEIETKDPSLKILSDTISYNFLDIKSFCDLFLYQKTSSFYAIVQQEDETNEFSTIDIYALASPPLSLEEIYDSENELSNSSYLVYIVIIFITISLAVLVFVKSRKNKKNIEESMPYILIKEEGSILEPQIESDVTSSTNNQGKVKSAIYLLGGFRAFDKEGNNITNSFSPTAKQILVYLLLNSLEDQKGTTSQKLDETFWFGMDKNSAANNRRVNISKLRLLLPSIGKAEIINKNNYWYLDLSDEIRCDYKDILSLIKTLDLNNPDKDTINKVINIAINGTLSPEIDSEWIDAYKSDFYIKLSEILLDLLKSPAVISDRKLSLKLADVILIHDNVDEDAIKIKCAILYQMKQKGLSKQSYDKFCDDYLRLLNAKPDFTFDEIIKDVS